MVLVGELQRSAFPDNDSNDAFARDGIGELDPAERPQITPRDPRINAIPVFDIAGRAGLMLSNLQRRPTVSLPIGTGWRGL